MVHELSSREIDNGNEFEGLKSIIVRLVELVESSNWQCPVERCGKPNIICTNFMTLRDVNCRGVSADHFKR
jgi:hypothetical protein